MEQKQKKAYALHIKAYALHIKAYAKINLGLDVLKKREDGYHEVMMIMQTVNIYDVLHFKKREDDKIIILSDNEEMPCNEDNLIYKAAKKMFEYADINAGVTIYLEKNIPVAAGMAGGSTDAAATLKGLNELFALQLSEKQLMEIGVSIGADVPYCIIGGTALAEGIGEILTPLPSPPEAVLLIVKPPISVSTQYVYQNLGLNKTIRHPDISGMKRAIAENDLTGMCRRFGNVLETVTIKKYPQIEQIKNEILNAGAINALMSGSGPTVFGVFETKEQAYQAQKRLEEQNVGHQIFITGFHSDSKGKA